MATKTTKTTKTADLAAAVRIVGVPVKVKVATLKAVTNWTRTAGEDLKIADLAARMAAEGQREAIWIRKGTSEVVAGNRRVAAAKINGWTEILAVEVDDGGKDTDLRANVAENVGASRAEITTAGLIHAIMEYQRRGYNVGQIATEIGRDASTVKAAINVNGAHPAVRAALAEYEAGKRAGTLDLMDSFEYDTGDKDKDGNPKLITLPLISFASARRIAEMPEADQLKILRTYGHLSSAKLIAKLAEIRAESKGATAGKGGKGGDATGTDDGGEDGSGETGNGKGGGKDADTMRQRAADLVVPKLDALAKRIGAIPEGHRAAVQAAFLEVVKAMSEFTGTEAFKAARRE